MADDNLYAGAKGEPSTTDSLAQYLEASFEDVRVNDFGLEPFTDEGRDERMMMFLGIARGLVNYLADHAAAFVIDDHGDNEDWEHDIDKTGHVRIRADGVLHPT
jgi:hypothetical protein